MIYSCQLLKVTAVRSHTHYLVLNPYKPLVAQALLPIGHLSSMCEMPRSTPFMKALLQFKGLDFFFRKIVRDRGRSITILGKEIAKFAATGGALAEEKKHC
jgi:hypothetical protein